MSTGIRTWTNWSTFERDPDLSPDAETGKSESWSWSNRHLIQSRLQVTRCTAERYCLLHVVVQGPGNFTGRLTFVYGLRLRSYGASNLPNFWILAFVKGTCAPPSALLVYLLFRDNTSHVDVKHVQKCLSVLHFWPLIFILKGTFTTTANFHTGNL